MIPMEERHLENLDGKMKWATGCGARFYASKGQRKKYVYTPKLTTKIDLLEILMKRKEKHDVSLRELMARSCSSS
jgi:hypothetical protein